MKRIHETLDGLPLGLSLEYDHLPRTGPLRMIHCGCCWRLYEDVERLTADGTRVMAVMCEACREKGRLKWLMENYVELPAAVVTFRKGT